MKQILIILFLFVQFYFGNAQYKNKVSVNIPYIFNWAYERKISTKLSWQVTAFVVPNYTHKVVSIFFTERNRYDGVGIIPELRYYPFAKVAMKGFYLAPFAQYIYLSRITTREYDDYYSYNVFTGSTTYIGDTTIVQRDNAMAIGGGLVLGGQIKISKKLNIDLYAGGGYGAGWLAEDLDNNTLNPNEYYRAIGVPLVRFGFRLGYYF